MSVEPSQRVPVGWRSLIRPGARTATIVAFLLVAAHMILFDRGLGGDGWATFAFVSSLVDDGDLALENNTHGVVNGLIARTDGRLAMQYPPGAAVLDLVPFLAGRAADAILPSNVLAAGVVVPPVGRVDRRTFLEIATIVAARNLAVLLGLGAVAVALGRLGLSRGTAACAAALAFFAGPLVFYALVGMTHAQTFALAALLLLVLAGDDGSRRRAVLAGIVVGLAVLVRYSAAALAVPLVLGVGGRGRWRRAGVALAACVAPLLALPLFWRVHHGQWLPLGYGGTFHPTLVSPWNVLLSAHHGLLFFHPALLLAVAGLLVGLRRGGPPIVARMSRVAIVWFLAVAVLHGWWSEWANTGGYGQRFIIDALPALALGFATLLRPVRTRRLAVAAIAVLVAFGYVLFLGAVTGLAGATDGSPWPQTLGDYAPLLEHPPGRPELARGFERASFVLRAVSGREEAPTGQAPAVPTPR